MIQLLTYIKEYKKDAIIAIFLVALETFFELKMTIVIGSFIDILSGPAEMNAIYDFAIKLLIIAILTLLFGTSSGWLSTKAASGLSKNLRNEMFQRIQNFSFSNIDKFSTNSLVTRMTTDVVNVQNAFMMTLRVTVKSPVSLICALFMAFSINWKIGLLYVVVIPVLFIALMIIAKLTHPIFQRVFRTYDRLNGIVREDIHGIRVVKSFVREEYETKKFENVSETIREDFTKAEKLIAFNPFLMQMAIYTCMVVISWFSASAIVESGNGSMVSGISMTTGELQNLLTCSMMILMSLMMLSMIYV